MLLELQLHSHPQDDVPPGPIYVRPEAVDALGYDAHENVVIYLRSGASFTLAERYRVETIIERLGEEAAVEVYVAGPSPAQAPQGSA